MGHAAGPSSGERRDDAGHARLLGAQSACRADAHAFAAIYTGLFVNCWNTHTLLSERVYRTDADGRAAMVCRAAATIDRYAHGLVILQTTELAPTTPIEAQIAYLAKYPMGV